MATFTWHPGERPPPIEDHSKAKLDVLRRYIRAYFDRLNVVPRREEFKLDLVDGFCGGGIFSDGNDIVAGSPLVMLEESKAAEERLNRSRSKPLRVDCKHYFVDKEPAHIEYLRETLADRDYNTTTRTSSSTRSPSSVPWRASFRKSTDGSREPGGRSSSSTSWGSPRWHCNWWPVFCESFPQPR